MGRFFSFVLILSGVSACGDNITPPQNRPASPAGAPGDNLGTLPAFSPYVCGESTWTNVVLPDPASHVSVVALPTAGSQVAAPNSAAVVAVPIAGGALTGFTIDARMDAIG